MPAAPGILALAVDRPGFGQSRGAAERWHLPVFAGRILVFGSRSASAMIGGTMRAPLTAADEESADALRFETKEGSDRSGPLGRWWRGKSDKACCKFAQSGKLSPCAPLWEFHVTRARSST